MTTALYRRYRPETFAEMIGQSQVTDPLMTALRGDRVGHAYLFSGPRGCGKTTSARILARCLNCAEGPTDTPCGVCPSCVELSRAGGGSLDVVEIDAASHNGVDDARDLRERATFAPSRDRYKIFILDEAHMVTPQGFNALLKLVEEPPAHVKFIFATTEPEKVLGTIRSRTHHYPFRLVPPAAMLEYVEKLCGEEGVAVEQGVLPLVVRAGGGSPRDTLSLLDQLIAGSDAAPDGGVTVSYERAVALLGYTHAALLDEIVDALAAGDASSAFPAVDRVVQTGQDPRRFVDDLLERLRDLIVIAAVGDDAAAVLRGVPDDELARMREQASAFGSERLSRTADLVSTALDDMTGATSPRLHLELLMARVLAATAAVPGTPAAPTARQTAAPAAPATAAAVPPQAATASLAPEQAVPPARAPKAPATALPAASLESEAPLPGQDAPVSSSAGTTGESGPSPSIAPAAPGAPVSFDRIRAAWPDVLSRLAAISRSSWLVVTAVQPLGYDQEGEVLRLGFASPHDVSSFKGKTPGAGPSDHLRDAIEQELGVRVKYLPAPLPPGGARSLAEDGTAAPSASGASDRFESAAAPPRPADPAEHPASAGVSPAGPRAASANAAPVTDWAVAPIPRGDAAQDPTSPAPVALAATPPPAQLPVDEEPADAEAMPAGGWYEPVHDGDVLDDEPPYPDDEPPEAEPPIAEPPIAPVAAAASVQGASAAPSPSAASSPSPDTGARPVSDTPSTPVPGPSAVPEPSARPELLPAGGQSRAGGQGAPGGVQRYGEAVVRQVLGATFVREEPYEPPTRFS
ncbi:MULTISPECIES: DNA polymerase III subunit gamma and tau [Bacteria]|uniref:DNA polymerase III subunit gamma and tau n=1 Tax=Bacteria TaxID=2 RepID=UPI003C7E43EC